MKKCVDQAIAHITEYPEKYSSCGNSEFSGFSSEEFKVDFAGNSIFFLGVSSIIHLYVKCVDITLSFTEKRELEKISKWWWDNVPKKQLGENDG